MPFSATWMDLQNIIFHEVIQRQILYDITYMWNLKIIQINLYTKQKQMHRHTKHTYAYQRGEGRREGQTRSMGLTDTNYCT